MSVLDRDALIGRDREIAELRALLAAGRRVVTLTGPGGVGKTRTARHLVEHTRGAVFVDLTEARDEGDTIATVARVLGVPLSALETARETSDTVGRALESRGDVVVVLDNVEQIVEPVALAVVAWLAAAPRTRFVITSRERLRVHGEIPLEIPPLEASASGGSASELFLARARMAGTEIERSPENLASIGALVNRLDGLPLAIELAASRTSVLSLGQLQARFTSRLDALGVGARDASQRHKTLRDAISWSWELLTDDERAALARCSVFAGGFTAELAEGVLGPRSLALLAALRDKSLLRSKSDGGAIRLHLLETIREYAAERLSAGHDEDPAFRAHAACVVAMAEACAGEAHRAGGLESLAALAREEDNVHAVIERAIARSADPTWVALGLRALVGVEPLQSGRSPVGFVGGLDALLAYPRDVPPTVFARGLLARARAQRIRGRLDEASADLARARTIAVSSDDVATLALVLAAIAEMSLVRGPSEEGSALYRDAVTAATSAGLHALAARHAANAAYFEARWSPSDDAIDAVFAAMDRLAEAGDDEGLTLIKVRFGQRLLDVGHVGRARALVAEARAGLRARGDVHQESWCLMTLGSAEEESGHLAEAETFHREAIGLARSAGRSRTEAIARFRLAIALRSQGRHKNALDETTLAVAFFRTSQDVRSLGIVLATHGALLAAVDRTDEAERAFAAAESALAPVSDAPVRAMLALERGHLDVLRARVAVADDADAGTAIAAAHDRLASARAPRGARTLAEDSYDVRAHARALVDALAQLEPGVDVLVVAPDGAWFRPPHGVRVGLDKRPTLARFLRVLVDARVDRPAEPVELDALLAGAWPEENILAGAAMNRIQVAVTTLRKLGLGESLQRVKGGWQLDPRLRTVRSARVPS